MNFKYLVLTLPIFFLLVLSYGCDNESNANDDTEPRLFVIHRSDSGMIELLEGDRMLLTLEGLSPITSHFSNTPNTRLGNLSTSDIVMNHFYDLSNPTKAVLEIHMENGAANVLPLNVHDLDFDVNSGVIEYEISMSPDLPEEYVNPNDHLSGSESGAVSQPAPMQFASNSIVLAAANQNPPTCSNPLDLVQQINVGCTNSQGEMCEQDPTFNPTGQMAACCRWITNIHCCVSCPVP